MSNFISQGISTRLALPCLSPSFPPPTDGTRCAFACLFAVAEIEFTMRPGVALQVAELRLSAKL
jgi:hypothetical protein